MMAGYNPPSVPLDPLEELRRLREAQAAQLKTAYAHNTFGINSIVSPPQSGVSAIGVSGVGLGQPMIAPNPILSDDLAQVRRVYEALREQLAKGDVTTSSPKPDPKPVDTSDWSSFGGDDGTTKTS